MKSARLLFLALLAVSPAVVGLGSPTVEQLDETSYPRQRESRIAIPWFDRENSLQWNDDLAGGAGGCSMEWFPGATLDAPRCDRTTVMVNPRVDECRCTGQTTAGGRTGIAYAGIDSRSRLRWRRQSRPPQQREVRSLAGAGATGLVFSDLEVWSPHTGETISPSVPGAASGNAACYLPDRGALLQFDAEVTPFSSRGGLYLRSPGRAPELVLPVDTGLLGYYAIEAMAPLSGTSMVLIAERYSTRGPGSARFELFDLASRKVVFRDERASGHYTTDLRVTAGSDGHAAFSFLDLSRGEHLVVHYRVR